jgi:hypothetical protein
MRPETEKEKAGNVQTVKSMHRKTNLFFIAVPYKKVKTLPVCRNVLFSRSA